VIRSLRSLAYALLGLLLLAPGALAVEDADLPTLTDGGGPTTTTVPSSGAADLGRVLLGLMLVVLVIGALYAGMKRTQRGKLPGGRASGSVKVVETTQLGPGRNLHLVHIGDRVLLVGATDHGITLLQGYDRDEATIEGLLEEREPDLTLLPAVREVQPKTFVESLRERTIR
jgi:flagellar biosynthetic protein FliO